VNTAAPSDQPQYADGQRVLEIQRKLHRWAIEDPARRFDDLYNLVCDPAFLKEGLRRVRANRGSRTAGIDGVRAAEIRVRGEEQFLAELRNDLKTRRFEPLPVRERMIPKPNGKRRRLGIPTTRDRVVQAALKLVLEPIFEADFKPCSYGFRPGRRAQDAIAEIHQLGSHGYQWVLEGDIEACFDNIEHTPLMDRVRRRVVDKRVLALVKAFLKAGILSEEGTLSETITGTPQGGILSPLLANIALSALDEHFAGHWETRFATDTDRIRERRHGNATYRLIRYADDFVVLVCGTEAHARVLMRDVAAALAPVGLRLSEAKTRVLHMDEGFEFLGWRIQRHRQWGSQKHHIYTYPAKKALAAVKAKVRALTRGSTNRPLKSVLHAMNRLLRGWTTYFRHGASKGTFGYLEYYSWRRVVIWLRRKHKPISWRELRRRYMPNASRWRPTENGVQLFDPVTVRIVRYRYRGKAIPTPWTEATSPATDHAAA
jgi:RNA-directed DNA polymerase